MYDHAWIAAHIPHQGSMCLLDAVERWNAECIVCRAVSHGDPEHPLRAEGRLGAAAGIEYAAQAMAVHGALLAEASASPRSGYLTSVRSVDLRVSRLDLQLAPLTIVAERLSGDSNHILYQFSVESGEVCLLSGRATVMLDAASSSLARISS
jgi:predicted hotdog family 3-hydroxylacyl-ACP dehydratase